MVDAVERPDFELVFAALERAGVRYLVVGGEGWARATVADLGDLHVPLASRADLIAMKRRAGRIQDLEDVRVLEALDRDVDG